LAELSTLVGALQAVRRRMLLNDWLHELARWSFVALLVLLLAALLGPSLPRVAQAAVVLAAFCVLLSLARAARWRPSLYEAAAKLDQAAALKDRLSTAYFFAHVEQPEGLLRCQRQDALRHLAQVSPQELFPLAAPASARRCLLLLLAVAALFAYRMQSGPPLLALLEKAGETRVVKAILTPIAHAMERERLAANRQPQPEPPEGQQGGSRETAGEEQSDAAGAQSGEAAPGNQQQGTPDNAPRSDRTEESSSGQNGAEGEEGEESQQGEEGSEQSADSRGQQGRQRSGEKQQNGGSKNSQSGREPQDSASDSESAGNQNQSLTRTMMQALKNLLASAMGAPKAQSRGQSGQNAAQGSPQQSPPMQGNSGNQSPQPGKGNERGSDAASNAPSGAMQPGGQKAGMGIGQQPGSEEGAPSEPLPASLKPDRVALDTQQFSGEAQVRARVGQGRVSSPARNVGGPSTAAVNGAEQENVPLRYRLYVQRYFDQAPKARK